MDCATIDSLCWQMATFKRLTLTAPVRCNAPLCQCGPHNSSSTVTCMYASWKSQMHTVFWAYVEYTQIYAWIWLLCSFSFLILPCVLIYFSDIYSVRWNRFDWLDRVHPSTGFFLTVPSMDLIFSILFLSGKDTMYLVDGQLISYLFFFIIRMLIIRCLPSTLRTAWCSSSTRTWTSVCRPTQ